jgi:hypothetical protein
VLCGVVLVGLLIALVVMVRRDAAPPVTMQHRRDTAVVVEPPIVHRLALDAAPDASERDNALASLRASGVGDEVWNGQATTLLDSFATNGVSINDRACFIAGCAATFTFASDRDYRERAAELVETDAYRAWTGGKRFTSTETRADGRIVVALLLYRPD